jgi:sugar/nucleoside kinase (ribokinase family)
MAHTSIRAIGDIYVRRLASAARRHCSGNDCLVVVRHGAKGCTYTDAKVSGQVPGIAVEAVDTTGAGATHIGVLLAGLLHGFKIQDALVRANAPPRGR